MRSAITGLALFGLACAAARKPGGVPSPLAPGEHRPDSRLVVLPRSGHMGHIEEPRPFADAVAALLASLPPNS